MFQDTLSPEQLETRRDVDGLLRSKAFVLPNIASLEEFSSIQILLSTANSLVDFAPKFSSHAKGIIVVSKLRHMFCNITTL